LSTWLTTGSDVAVLGVQGDVWRFSHDKLREGILGVLTETERPDLHIRVAEAVEKIYPEASEQVATLAHLWGVACDDGKELHYSRLAGEQAVKANANAEAIGHLSRALELLARVPDSPDRDQQELSLRMTLGPPLVFTQGYSSAEVANCYNRTVDICNQMGATPQLIPILLQLGTLYYFKAEYKTALELGRRMLEIEKCEKDPVIVTSTRLMNGVTLAVTGDLDGARAHFECGLAAYDPAQHSYYAHVYGHDVGISLLVSLSVNLCIRGFPDQARDKSMKAIKLARTHDHPFIIVQTLIFGRCHVSYLRREVEAVKECSEEAIALCKEYDFPFFKAWGKIYKGWTLIEEEEYGEGIQFLQEGIAAVRTIGAKFLIAAFLSVLAEGYLKNGQFAEGTRTLSEALTTAKKSGERGCECMVQRKWGELLVMRGESHGEIEQCFSEAVSIALGIGSKCEELKTVLSLCRFWQRQGRRSEAREKLAEIYNWFTEGFETRDLQEAKVLLNELQ